MFLYRTNKGIWSIVVILDIIPWVKNNEIHQNCSLSTLFTKIPRYLKKITSQILSRSKKLSSDLNEVNLKHTLLSQELYRSGFENMLSILYYSNRLVKSSYAYYNLK